jgi:hypothetical protein
MAIDKSSVAIMNTVTLTAGAATTYSDIDVSSYHNVFVHLRILNGATAPTVPARMFVRLGVDNDGGGTADYWCRFGGDFSGQITSGGAVAYNLAIPRGAKYLQVGAGGNSGQNVTVEAWATVVNGY